MLELKPKEGMTLLKCPYKCAGGFEGGLDACSCRSKPIFNNLVGHTFLERAVKDTIVNAIASLRKNNQAAVYNNDEKNSRDLANLSIIIPVIPFIPERYHRETSSGMRTNRTFSDVLLTMRTTLHLTSFPTIADKPRHQQYHVESEKNEARNKKLTATLKNSSPLLKDLGHHSLALTFTFPGVERDRRDSCAARLKGVAENKRKEYQAAYNSFLGIVRARKKEISQVGEPEPSICSFAMDTNGSFCDTAILFLKKIAVVKFSNEPGSEPRLAWKRANWVQETCLLIQDTLLRTASFCFHRGLRKCFRIDYDNLFDSPVNDRIDNNTSGHSPTYIPAAR